MIPPFNEHGYLPSGIHSATIDEVAARFGRESEVCRVQMESLHWLVHVARRAGVSRLVLNGSFVTDVLEPNDVDCVLLIGAGFPRDESAEAEMLAGLPFLELNLLLSHLYRAAWATNDARSSISSTVNDLPATLLASLNDANWSESTARTKHIQSRKVFDSRKQAIVFPWSDRAKFFLKRFHKHINPSL